MSKGNEKTKCEESDDDNNGYSSGRSNKGNDKNPKNCIWCDQPRTRHDLCNRCRQKVESRARRLMEQKMVGDWHLFDKIQEFANTHCNFVANCSELLSLLCEIGPFLFLKLQCQTTYDGKRANNPWVLPEAMAFSLVKDLFNDKNEEPKLDGKKIKLKKTMGRQNLCAVLNEIIFEKLEQFKKDRLKTTRNNEATATTSSNNSNNNSNSNSNSNNNNNQIDVNHNRTVVSNLTLSQTMNINSMPQAHSNTNILQEIRVPAATPSLLPTMAMLPTQQSFVQNQHQVHRQQMVQQSHLQLATPPQQFIQPWTNEAVVSMMNNNNNNNNSNNNNNNEGDIGSFGIGSFNFDTETSIPPMIPNTQPHYAPLNSNNHNNNNNNSNNFARYFEDPTGGATQITTRALDLSENGSNSSSAYGNNRGCSGYGSVAQRFNPIYGSNINTIATTSVHSSPSQDSHCEQRSVASVNQNMNLINLNDESVCRSLGWDGNANAHLTNNFDFYNFKTFDNCTLDLNNNNFNSIGLGINEHPF